MKKILLSAILIFALGKISAQDAAVNANDICAPLPGDAMPEANLKNLVGETVTLKKVLDKKPAVVIFYRGSWCPYCNKHLSKIQGIEKELQEMGFQIIAISPDLPENMAKSISKNELSYTLLSDTPMKLARDLSLSFVVSSKTIKKYKLFGINLEKASGEAHHELPVPAVLLVNKDGQIDFSYVNPNYKKRLSAEVVLAAARAMLED